MPPRSPNPHARQLPHAYTDYLHRFTLWWKAEIQVDSIRYPDVNAFQNIKKADMKKIISAFRKQTICLWQCVKILAT
jgi:hypothetical protein